ncbi:polyprenyl synthetase family protein [Streptomyces rishiriensis]|uniref:Geranylgeranyl diphosphate synthase type I n=1 Tax=Streptomyces rishiriensis TaxID=68264 RepID=A0ABU0P375_STRRH|nr:polyprenyl synthetase family protein [Streptomyces rishiriensis]MDQ0585841.1 geranylgeranyl diphosphate synthase type I [Streptomyces rishiriensis]
MTTAVTRRAATDQEPAASARRTVEDLLQRVQDRLSSFLAAERAHYAEVHDHAVVAIDALSDLATAGGKLIRPAFCLTGYLAAGGDPDDPAIVDAAAALELLHISALVHDDVLDDSRTRRGKPAVHLLHSTLHRTRGWQGESRRFGEGVALLVGDLALVYSDELMSTAPRGAFAEWHRLRSEVMIGQYMDVAAAAEFSIDPDLSRLIALIKSGRYTIHRPLVVGASAAGRADLAPALAQYGEAVGEAFQLRDDLLDAFGDSAQTGKTAGLDFSQHKMTLLLGWAMQRDARIRDLITEPGHTPDEIRGRLLDTGVPEDVERHIAALVEQGRTAIADAPVDAVWRGELANMALRVAYRNK